MTESEIAGFARRIADGLPKDSYWTHEEMHRALLTIAELRRERDLARGQCLTYREMLDVWYEDGRKLGREEARKETDR